MGEVRARREVRAGEFRDVEDRVGEVRAPEVRVGKFRVGEDRVGKARVGEGHVSECRKTTFAGPSSSAAQFADTSAIMATCFSYPARRFCSPYSQAVPPRSYLPRAHSPGPGGERLKPSRANRSRAASRTGGKYRDRVERRTRR